MVLSCGRRAGRARAERGLRAEARSCGAREHARTRSGERVVQHIRGWRAPANGQEERRHPWDIQKLQATDSRTVLVGPLSYLGEDRAAYARSRVRSAAVECRAAGLWSERIGG